MPLNGSREAHDYSERIRERLQELRQRCGLSKYDLARESGISREYIRAVPGKMTPNDCDWLMFSVQRAWHQKYKPVAGTAQSPSRIDIRET